MARQAEAEGWGKHPVVAGRAEDARGGSGSRGVCRCCECERGLDAGGRDAPAWPSPAVVLIEPPCLVSGTACEVEVHVSRAVSVGLLTVSRDGHFLADAPPPAERQRTIRIPLPAIDTCRVRVAIKSEGLQGGGVAPCMLSLPESVADEFRRLFERMYGTVCSKGPRIESQQTSGARGAPDGPKAAQGYKRRRAKELAWSSRFAPFCSHFADLLEGLPQADDQTYNGCAEVAGFFLKSRMWSSASFLLRACLRSGAPVTLGPYALSGEDLEAGRLRKDFLALSEEASRLTVGGTSCLRGGKCVGEVETCSSGWRWGVGGALAACDFSN